MSKTIKHILLCGLLVTVFDVAALAQTQNNLSAKVNAQPQPASGSSISTDSDRARDGLNGPVRRIRTETSKLLNSGGKQAEDKRVMLETAAYDVKGTKTENAYFPVSGATLTGKEVYKYDDKGNISEMTLHGADGSLIAKEVYSYEYDFVGNWTKMTTSVAVITGGKITFEPTEVTYRTITYYLDENMEKMAQPVQPAVNASAQPAAAQPTPSPSVQPAANSSAAANHATSTKTSVVALPKSNAANEKVSATIIASNGTPAGSKSGEPKVVMEGDAPSAAPSTAPSAGGEQPARPRARLLKPVSGGVLNGSAVSLPMPTYPEPARRMRLSGTISVEVVVDETGKVISAKATGGSPILTDAAVKAAYRAHFSPTLLSGQPVKISGIINYVFSLAQ
jgi:protein TonB